jgi:vancomycin permeability regulator SanA
MKRANQRANSVARGLALFLGGFTIVGIVQGFLTGTDATEWFVTWLGIGSFGSRGVVGFSAVTLVLYGLGPNMSRTRKQLTSVGIVLLLGLTIVNGVSFYFLLAQGRIASPLPLPLSLLFALVLILILKTIRKESFTQHCSGGDFFRTALVCAAACLLFPLSQMVFFGKTDYRRSADAAVVFGSRVYANGQLSDALADRVRTACDLHRQGLVKALVFSGGPGEGAVHEVEAMKRFAISLGIAEEDIITDFKGLNTQATARNVSLLAREHGFTRLLAVSHFYHLPRVKLTFENAHLNVYTVPAQEPQLLAKLPIFMLREIAAWWLYYSRGVIAASPRESD